MVAKVHTVAFQGIEVREIDVQVQLSSGLSNFLVVGLPDKAVAESRERIRASFHSIGLSLPFKRITVNLAPADMKKEGSHYDLPMALGLLIEMQVLCEEEITPYSVMGELGLDGSLASVAGILPAAINALSKGKGLICPALCGPEAAWAGGLDIVAAPHLLALLTHFRGKQLLPRPEAKLPPSSEKGSFPRMGGDLIDVKGQEMGKRALEVAAAGGHHLLMIGPPGSGKSMLARRLPGLLPALLPEEALAISTIHSLAGTIPEGGLMQMRPFRDPHHSATLPALIGGGVHSRPGEISLAHLGVLFLDELPEFSRNTLESLRQPLEAGHVSIARANAHISYPACIQLIAAMNPCHCGFLGDPVKECARAPKCGEEYQNRLSGPLWDRFDLTVEIPSLTPGELAGEIPLGEPSIEVALRILEARNIQYKRYKNENSPLKRKLNAYVEGEILSQVTLLNESGQKLLRQATEKLHLSARGFHRILKVSRTLADLEGAETVSEVHISEALGYRRCFPSGRK